MRRKLDVVVALRVWITQLCEVEVVRHRHVGYITSNYVIPFLLCTLWKAWHGVQLWLLRIIRKRV